MGTLPPVFIEFLGSATGFHATAKGVRTELAAVEAQGGGSLAKLGAVSKAAFLGIGIAAVLAAVKTVHMAADFETQMTRVRTSAGESAANMKMVGQGVLSMAGDVGQSSEQLTTGLYMVESAGFHGADALRVLRTSAMGAKVGNAELGSVTDATTTALNAYGLKAGDVTGVMNALVATEASGKTNMEALATSMSSILPVAASAGVGLQEVLAAMATMTSQGTSAKVAATYLRQTIGQLSNPTAKAAQTMRGLGLDSVKVSQNLGKNGLASTLTMLTDAIDKRMGPSGVVMVETLRKASSNTTEFQKTLAGLPPSQKTYIGALATMVGGTKSMMAALQLTGPHMDTFKKNTQGIAEHVKAGGKQVEGWSDVQKTFNQRMAEAKGALEAIGIQIGQKLMPVASKMVDMFAGAVTWMTKHKTAAEALGIAIGVVLFGGLVVAATAAWTFAAAMWATGIPEIILAVVALVAVLAYLALHWKDIAHWLVTAWHATIKWLGGVWQWLADETSRIWHDDIVAPIVRAWDSVTTKLSNAYHAVVDPIVRAWHSVSDATVRVWNGITAWFKKWWPLLLVVFATPIAILVSTWNHTHKAISDTVSSAWNAISDFLAMQWQVIVLMAQGVWALVRDYIVAPVLETWHAIRGVWNAVASWLSKQWATIRGVAAAAWARIRTAIVDPIISAWHSVTTYAGHIATTIYDKLRSAWDRVKSVGTWFESIGSAIVQGIIKGISGAAGGLMDRLRGLADDALSSAEHFLGINSPSRKAADRIGQWIPPGIADGVRRTAHLVGHAVNAATGAALDGPRVGGGTLAMGTSGGGTVIHHHTHIEVHGSVLAEQQLRDTLQTEMLRLGARNSNTWAPYKR